jgi:hypothetical protein
MEPGGMMEASLFSHADQLRRVSPHWCLSRDGDPWAYDLSRRHYSKRRYKRARQPLFVGPGRKLVLLSSDGRAVFAWRQFIDDTQPAQTGFCCSIFRNEGRTVSSQLIVEATDVVWSRWGNERCYTLIDASRIRSTNPGYCFLMAGWRRCGVTANGKIILEIFP